MMKGNMRLFAAAMGAAVLAAPAQAATIIQTGSEQTQQTSFTAFDTGLGTLTRVTLAISIAKSRVWQLNGRPDTPSSADVAWTVDGNWRLGSSIASLDGTLVALTGRGSSTVALDQEAPFGSFGYFQTDVAGGTSLDLDPGQFTGGPISFDGFDLGHNAPQPSDTKVTVPAGTNAIQLGGSCVLVDGFPSQPAGEDFCGAANYTLTYEYTAAVPEPGTWGLMLVGFGTMGAALRRRRRTATAGA